MNNIGKTGLLTFVFTVITIGLFGISAVSMINNVFAKKDIGKNNNIEKNTDTSDTSKSSAKNVVLRIQDVDR